MQLEANTKCPTPDAAALLACSQVGGTIDSDPRRLASAYGQQDGETSNYESIP
jgi:hypothetical protein